MSMTSAAEVNTHAVSAPLISGTSGMTNLLLVRAPPKGAANKKQRPQRVSAALRGRLGSVCYEQISKELRRREFLNLRFGVMKLATEYLTPLPRALSKPVGEGCDYRIESARV